MENNTQRTWSQFSEQSFRKFQDLEAVIATNEETIVALDESINVHKKGQQLLNTEDTQGLSEQFQYIIDKHTDSRHNLQSFNDNANVLLGLLREETGEKVLQVVEQLFTIISFK
jgi:exonuclease VII small subunit